MADEIVRESDIPPLYLGAPAPVVEEVSGEFSREGSREAGGGGVPPLNLGAPMPVVEDISEEISREGSREGAGIPPLMNLGVSVAEEQCGEGSGEISREGEREGEAAGRPGALRRGSVGGRRGSVGGRRGSIARHMSIAKKGSIFDDGIEEDEEDVDSVAESIDAQTLQSDLSDDYISPTELTRLQKLALAADVRKDSKRAADDKETIEQKVGSWNKLSKDQRFEALRHVSRMEQTKGPIWNLLIVMLGHEDPADKDWQASMIKKLDVLMDGKGRNGINPFKNGPMGELPMHCFFLLAYSGRPDCRKLMIEMGKSLVKKFHLPLKDMNYGVSMPYTSDLEPLIRDEYIRPDQNDGGVYTGGTILAMAIVNHDHDTARWLVEHCNASLQSRATGVFFQPGVIRRLKSKEGEGGFMSDFWAVLRGWDRQRFPPMEIRQNKEAAFANDHFYYGELPLSFATTVGNLQIIEMLLRAQKRRIEKHFKARMGVVREDEIEDMQTEELRKFVSLTDSLGNTALHIAVLHQRKAVFDLLMRPENHGEACMEILNHDGLTPFTLAARHGHVSMFEHILARYHSQTVWAYGDVQLRKTDLTQVDTFRSEIRVLDDEHSHTNASKSLHANKRWRGALEIVVMHEVDQFAGQKLINHLVLDKWNRYGRSQYIMYTVLPYLFFMALFTSTVIMRCQEVRRDWNKVLLGEPDDHGAAIFRWIATLDTSWAVTDDLTMSSRLLEMLLALVCVIYLLPRGWRRRRLTPMDIDPKQSDRIDMFQVGRTVYKNLDFILTAGISVLVIAAVGCRFVGWDWAELSALAVACVLVFCRLLHTLMPFKIFGVLTIMIWRIFVQDLLLALIIYLILLSAFSMAMFVMFQKSDFPTELVSRGNVPLDIEPSATFLELIWVSIGEVDISEMILLSQNPSIAFTFHMIWIILSDVLVLNLLIAMMSRTYEEDNANAHRLWFFPFAEEVLRKEKNMSQRARVELRSGKPGHADSDMLSYEEKQEEKYWHFELEALERRTQDQSVQATTGPHGNDSAVQDDLDHKEQKEKDEEEMLQTVNALQEQISAIDQRVPDSLMHELERGQQTTIYGLQQTQGEILGALAPLHNDIQELQETTVMLGKITNGLKRKVNSALGKTGGASEYTNYSKLDPLQIKLRAKERLQQWEKDASRTSLRYGLPSYSAPFPIFSMPFPKDELALPLPKQALSSMVDDGRKDSSTPEPDTIRRAASSATQLSALSNQS